MRTILLVGVPMLVLLAALPFMTRADTLTLVLAEGDETVCGLNRASAALGHDVDLVLENRSGESYVLSAPLFFASAEPRLTGSAPGAPVAAEEEVIEIAPNDTAIVTLTPRAAGLFAFECFPSARPAEIARAGLAVGEGS